MQYPVSKTLISNVNNFFSPLSFFLQFESFKSIEIQNDGTKDIQTSILLPLVYDKSNNLSSARCLDSSSAFFYRNSASTGSMQNFYWELFERCLLIIKKTTIGEL